MNLAGRVVNDAGSGVNGASIDIYPVGSGTPDATTTTANHPVNNDAGWWSVTGLAATKVYRVKVTYSGNVREFYGLSEVQFNRLTVGKDKLVVDESGNLTSAATITGAAIQIAGVDVVTGVTNDTNVTGSKTGAQLTLGWQSTLAEARGGTGTGTYTLGDTLYSDATNSLDKLAGNTSTTKKFLNQTGTGSASAAPSWNALADVDIPATLVRTSTTLTAGTGLSGGGDLSTNRSFAVTEGSTIQKVTVRKNTGADVGSQKRLNFIEGANCTLTVNNEAGSNEVTVTIAAADPGSVGYTQMAEEGTNVTQRQKLNFIGASLTCADNAGNTRTDVTLSQSPSNSTSVVGTGRTFATTAPLAGGGDHSSDRTLSLAGLSTLGTSNQLPGVVDAGGSWEYKTLLGTSNRLTVTHAAGSITLDVGANVLLNTRQISTTNPLAGGGDLTTNRTFTVGGLSSMGTANYVVAVNSSASGWEYKQLAVTAGEINISHGTNLITIGVGASIVKTSRSFSTTTPLAGGGDFTADRTLSLGGLTTYGVSGQLVKSVGTGWAYQTTGDGGGLDADSVDGTHLTSLVQTSRSVASGTGLTGGGNLSADRTLSVVEGATVQKVNVQLAGSLVGTRKTVNLIQGANCTLTVADAAGDDRVNVTIAGAAPGSAGYTLIQDTGSNLFQRQTLNFESAAFVLADNGGSTRTDVSLTSSPTNSTTLVGTGRSVSVTSPLTGGGDLSADRTLSINGLSGLGTGNQLFGTNATPNACEYKTLSGTTNLITVSHGAGTITLNVGSSVVQTSRSISTTTPLTGGGDLSTNRTVAINGISGYGTAGQLVATTGSAWTYQSQGTGSGLDADTIDGSHATNFVSTSRQVTSTTPLSGGGDFTANRTISLAGLTTIGSANYLVGVNGTPNGWEYKQLLGTSGRLTVTHTTGAITLDIVTGSFVTNTRQVATRAPLEGGGDLSADRTIGISGLSAMGGSNQVVGMTAGAGSWEYKTLSGTTNLLSVSHTQGAITLNVGSNVVQTGRRVDTTSPLLGGGDLSGDRTLTLAGLTTVGTANYVVGVNSGGTTWEYKQLVGTTNLLSVTHGAGSVTLNVGSSVVQTSRSVGTTSPLAGGGDLSADRTMSLAGLTTLGTINYVVGVNASASAWEYKQLTSTATDIGISHGTGTVTISTGSNIPKINANNTFTGSIQTIASSGHTKQIIKGTGDGDTASSFELIYDTTVDKVAQFAHKISGHLVIGYSDDAGGSWGFPMDLTLGTGLVDFDGPVVTEGLRAARHPYANQRHYEVFNSGTNTLTQGQVQQFDYTFTNAFSTVACAMAQFNSTTQPDWCAWPWQITGSGCSTTCRNENTSSGSCYISTYIEGID